MLCKVSIRDARKDSCRFHAPPEMSFCALDQSGKASTIFETHFLHRLYISVPSLPFWKQPSVSGFDVKVKILDTARLTSAAFAYSHQLAKPLMSFSIIYQGLLLSILENSSLQFSPAAALFNILSHF